MEESAAGDQRLRRPLDVEDAGPSRHPLGGAIGDQAAPAGGVLVLKGAVDHVGHGLEAAMRMPGRALRFARSVLHLTHLIHVNEGIQQPLVEPIEGAAHGEPLALDALRRRGDGEQRTVDAGRTIKFRQTRQRQDVFDSDGGHGTRYNSPTRLAIPITSGA